MKKDYRLVLKKKDESLCVLQSDSECSIKPGLTASILSAAVDRVLFVAAGVLFSVEFKKNMIYITPAQKGKWCIYHKRNRAEVHLNCMYGFFEYRYDGDEFTMKCKSSFLNRKGPILLDEEFALSVTTLSSR